MDARRAGTCDRCGQANPEHGLWCRQCGTPLKRPLEPATAAYLQDKSLTAAIELYGQVLEDLQGLADGGEVPAATYETIKSFYAERLAEKRAQEEARLQFAAVQKYVSSARSLAHAATPRLPEAVLTLEEGIKKFPDETIFQELVQEIRSQIAKREQAIRAAAAARDLLAAAKACLQRAEFEAAEAQLKEALELAPENQEILTTLARVQRSLAEQRRPPVSQPTPLSESSGQQTHEVVIDAVLLQPASESIPAATTPGSDAWGEVLVLAEQPWQAAKAAAFQAASPARRERDVTDRTPAAPSFVEEEEVPSPTQRWVEAASEWSKVLKPFLLDNVGWFIGAFLIIAGFVVLITTFWRNIEENQILMSSLVYFSLVATTGFFFAVAYFMRIKRPALETSSNVLLIIVSLLIPLVFAAAALTTLVPPAG